LGLYLFNNSKPKFDIIPFEKNKPLVLEQSDERIFTLENLKYETETSSESHSSESQLPIVFVNNVHLHYVFFTLLRSRHVISYRERCERNYKNYSHRNRYSNSLSRRHSPTSAL